MLMQQMRKELGWSQARLAREAQLSASTVSQIENGRLRPYRSQLIKVRNALDFRGDIDDLIRDSANDKDEARRSTSEEVDR